MATQYHLTPEGPRKCSVDPSKPNSRGCKYDSMHFDNFEDAMEVYSEELEAAFGKFSVLVRPSAKERARRIGYRGLDGIDRVQANPQVKAAVASLKTIGAKAREAVAEIRSHYNGEVQPAGQASSLPETVSTAPLAEIPLEDQAAEANSEETFSSGREESLQDFSNRIIAKSSEASFKITPVDGTAREEALSRLEEFEKSRSEKAKPQPTKAQIKRSAKSRKAALAKARVRSAVNAGKERTTRVLIDSGYMVRASAAAARDTAKLKAQSARVRSAAAARIVQQRAARMSVPAAHIRPGDTFDGTTVRAVEAVALGKIKISYQAVANGPVLSATVPSDRAMRVDRKTRREARNSRISSRIATPIARTRALSSRVLKASNEQLSGLDALISRDARSGAVAREIRQFERKREQLAIINRLRTVRTETPQRVLQDS